MAKIDGRVLVHPIGSGKPSAQFSVSWVEYPKTDREKKAVEAVSRWARDKYRGCSVYVEKGSIGKLGDEGRGHLHVNGMEVAHFTAVAIPEPAPAAPLFGGGC